MHPYAYVKGSSLNSLGASGQILPVADSARSAAGELAGLLDTPFLRALAEPARLEVLKVLLVEGSGDVASIAARLPQDRSVVSRHLRTLEDAGIVRSEWQGRHRRYAIDGSFLVKRFETLSSQVRSLAAICCPPGGSEASPLERSAKSKGKKPSKSRPKR